MADEAVYFILREDLYVDREPTFKPKEWISKCDFSFMQTLRAEGTSLGEGYGQPNSICELETEARVKSKLCFLGVWLDFI